MRKLPIGLFTLLTIVAGPRPADATMFTLESYATSLRAGDAEEIALFSQNLLPASTSFQLSSVTRAYTENLLGIGAADPFVTGTAPLGALAGALNVNGTIGTSGAAQGGGATVFLGGPGYLAWSNPNVLAFGATGPLQVFGVRGFGVVTPNLGAGRPDPASQPVGVPEPATLLLMGIGIAGIAAREVRARSSRRRG